MSATPDRLTADYLRLVAESVNALSFAATDDEDANWRSAIGRVRKDVSGWTETELETARNASRHLCTRNEFAIGGLTCRRNYVVGQGFAYGVDPAPGVDKNAAPVAACREFVDAVVELNGLADEVPAEACWRLDRDGEYLIRVFPGESGDLPTTRFVEPECVRNPNGNAGDQWKLTASLRYGVQTKKGDTGTVTHYHLDAELDTKTVPVPEREIVHHKANSDSAFPRGVPVYFPVDANLRDCEDLLKAMSSTAKARAKLALLIKLGQITTRYEESLQTRLLSGTQSDARGGNRTVNVEEFPFGAIVRMGKDDEWTMPNSNVGASDTVAVLQARLRGVSIRMTMPEWMFTGLADQKYSNAFVTEAPVLKEFQSIQSGMVKKFGTGRLGQRASVLWRMVRLGVERGLLPAECLTACRITCKPQSLEVRDRGQEASVNKTYLDAGVKSVETVQVEQGLDPEQERQRGAKPSAASGNPPPQEGMGGTPPVQPGGLPTVPPPVPVAESAAEPAWLPDLMDRLGDLEAAAAALAAQPAGEGGAPPVSRAGSHMSEPSWVAEVRRRIARVEGHFAEALDRSHLVKKVITNKAGKKQTVYVNPNKGKTATPKPAAPAKADAKAAARDAVTKALADPSKLDAKGFEALAGHLKTLTVPELKEFQKSAGLKGGKVKQDHIDKLTAYLSTERAKPVTDGPAEVPAGYTYKNIGDPAELKAVVTDLFGGEIDQNTIAAVGNAGVGSEVFAYASEAGGLVVSTRKGGVSAAREIRRDGRGKLVCRNTAFEITDREKLGGKTGTDLFVNQVKALKELGVTKIDTNAAGDKVTAHKGEYNGYYTWPRLGFDAPIESRRFKRLPAEIQQAMGKRRRLLDLFAIPGGPEAWKEKGGPVNCEFDLTDGSPSMLALDAYAKRRRDEAK